MNDSSGDESDEELAKHTFRWDLSNIDDYGDLAKFGPGSLSRDGIVLIQNRMINGKVRFIVKLFGKVFGADAKQHTPKGFVDLNKTSLHQLVQRCRDTWLNEVVRRRWNEPGLLSIPRPGYWFQEKITQRREVLDTIAPKLAEAGAELFKVLFEDGDEAIVDVGRRLRQATRQKSLILTIYADEFFVPWSLIYTGTNVKPAEKEGFWGYRHIIEHSIDQFHPSMQFGVTNGKLQLGLCYNAGDVRIAQRVVKQLAELKRRANLLVVSRTIDAAVRTAFKANPYPDAFTQFYVHCNCSGSSAAPELAPPRFQVENRQITATDIVTWIPSRLHSEPFFLLNACEGGQMVTLFYESFALELLRRGAKGLIGPQVELPMVFASAYTSQFLNKLFEARPPNRVGRIVQQLTQEFWDLHNNPLGLVYSLYRGADCFLPV